jgi:hypothetical protein
MTTPICSSGIRYGLNAPLYRASQASAHRQILQGKPLTD